VFCVQPTSRNEALRGSRFFQGAAKHALIVAGGVEPDPTSILEHLGKTDLVLAADGGYRLLEKLAIDCDLLVGDFDTLTASEIEQAERTGCRVERYPVNKAKSDLEIAIDQAYESGATEVTLLGALGGEWDHCVANILAPLSLCAEYGMWGRLLTAEAQIYLVQGEVSVRAAGQRVSLAALTSRVEGLSLHGMQYPLRGAELRRSQTLGLANRVVEARASIEFCAGEILLTVMTKPERSLDKNGPKRYN
jgi:thiamine pyrophosphokinase